MKNIIITILAIIIIGGGAYLYMSRDKDMNADPNYINNNNASTTLPIVITKSTSTASADAYSKSFVIGTSTEGEPISAYTYGTGTKEIILVAGIHSDFSLNTYKLAEELRSEFYKNRVSTLENVKVTIISMFNPVVHLGVGDKIPVVKQRSNINGVDLNRNFDCEWRATGKFQTYNVSGGSAPFSESESKALRDYVLSAKPVAVIAYFSAAGGVYPSACDGKTNADSITLTNLYASSSKYTAHKSFDAYETSGDMTNWLASINVPAISVLLTDHENIELDRNLKGLQSIIDYYNK